MKIESLNNSNVKRWKNLLEKKYREQEGLFLIEGDHLLKEALNLGLVKEIMASEEDFEVPGIPFYLVSDAILKKLSNQVSGTKVMAVVRKMEEKEIRGKVCVLDNIQDPGNLGAIIRSAVAFGIDTIVMSKDTVDLYNDKVIRASEGMIFHLNYYRGDLDEAFLKLKEMGYKIYGTNVKKGVNLKEIKFDYKSAIIIGNEGKGMREEYQKYCDSLINILISDKCESLNASVAASIIFYEMSDNNEF